MSLFIHPSLHTLNKARL